MDSAAPTADKLEIAIVRKDPADESRLIQRMLTNEEVTSLISRAQELQAGEQASS